jgi:hypothetical protein
MRGCSDQLPTEKHRISEETKDIISSRALVARVAEPLDNFIQENKIQEKKRTNDYYTARIRLQRIKIEIESTRLDKLRSDREDGRRKDKELYVHDKFKKAMGVARHRRIVTAAVEIEGEIDEPRTNDIIYEGSIAPGSTTGFDEESVYQQDLDSPISLPKTESGKLFKSAFYRTQADLIQSDRTPKMIVKHQYKPEFSMKKRPLNKLPPIQQVSKICINTIEQELSKETDFTFVDAMKQKYYSLSQENKVRAKIPDEEETIRQLKRELKKRRVLKLCNLRSNMQTRIEQ